MRAVPKLVNVVVDLIVTRDLEGNLIVVSDKSYNSADRGNKHLACSPEVHMYYQDIIVRRVICWLLKSFE